ncbi:helix-turn-helix domain-containing protein [Palleronia caenipelagi]|uniref:DUF4115 domain-containing protein n=1 Tax=Palleronia caenipelagi TaxID=2489174 RepID=A0A547Q073_9RHOB|nr:helix-turn-helix domain-containing protein [Palleronia caenipelagi]TRD19783.1 DUF4115 domain-containing protein [Palleronia caenipelagi]
MIGRFRQSETVEIAEPKSYDDFKVSLGDVMRGERATLGKSLLDVQRDLKIKATYIAAIEKADPTAFETPGFIAGYVRSYARYLGLDTEWAFKVFCEESGFAPASGMSETGSISRKSTAGLGQSSPFGSHNLAVAPAADGFFARLEPGAIGSLVVVAGLIGVLGFGGFKLLNEVQKVQLAPVDQTPELTAVVDPLEGVAGLNSAADDPAAEAVEAGFDRLYRPEALDVPVLVARDSPIGSIDPMTQGMLADLAPPTAPSAAELSEIRLVSAPDRPAVSPQSPILVDAGQAAPGAPQVFAGSVPEVVVIAVRPSWVRVRAADGTTIYEKTMQEGDRFVLPKTEDPATLRTGESGAIYFAVNGTAVGPAGAAGQVTGGLELSAENLSNSYEVADLDADTALQRVVVALRQEQSELPPGAEAASADIAE